MRDPLYFRDFGYDRRLLPVRALRKLEHGATQENSKSRTGFTIGYPGWNLIYFLVQSQFRGGAAGTIIETGTNRGATTAILAQGLVDRGVTSPRVLTFEIDPQNVQKALTFLKRCGVSSAVEIYTGDTKETLAPALKSTVQEKSVRLAFLDASHFFNDVAFEFDAVLPYLANDAIVIFDNTYPIAEKPDEPRVAQFLDGLIAQYGGSLIELPFLSWFTPGVAIWQQQRPDWSHIVASGA